jgi:hypothetical protein
MSVLENSGVLSFLAIVVDRPVGWKVTPHCEPVWTPTLIDHMGMILAVVRYKQLCGSSARRSFQDAGQEDFEIEELSLGLATVRRFSLKYIMVIIISLLTFASAR